MRAFKRNPDTVLIQDCYVLPEYRKQGYASSWIKALNKNCISIVLKESDTYDLSVTAQLKAGFKVIEENKAELWLRYVKKE